MSKVASIISELELQRQAIDRAIQALREIDLTELPGAKPGGRLPGKKTRGGKRNMSAEGRARIAEAARRRWAEVKAAQQGGAAKKSGRTIAAQTTEASVEAIAVG